MIYFETRECWGACYPKAKNSLTTVCIEVEDVHGRSQRKKFEIPRYLLAEARKYNPSFGQTYQVLHDLPDIFDLGSDKDGNLQ